MSDILLKTLITFFSIYGFVEFVKEFFCYLSSNKAYNDIVIVVKVKNAEDTLEATIRSLVWKSLAYTRGNHMPQILIVDLDSQDSTAEIAKRLCKDYSFIQYTTNDLYLKAKNKTKE